ncbi:MAG: hypothetical protein R2741_11500 [Methanolobus sp.]
MEELLATPVIRTVAAQKKGICELLDKVIEQKKIQQHHGHEIGYGNGSEDKILEIEKVLNGDENRDCKISFKVDGYTPA